MSIYAIGNIQGRFKELQKLLAQLEFDPQEDVLWLSGNMVGEHQSSYQVLQYVRSLGSRAVSVLGNKELDLLAMAEGLSDHDAGDYDDILSATERDEILKWLRQCPLLHHDMQNNFVMVHGGIAPEWTLSQAKTFAIELESALSFGDHKNLLANTRHNPPRRWNAKLRGWNRLQFIRYALTCMGESNDKGYMDFGVKVPQNNPQLEYVPWYRTSQRHTTGVKILFSHYRTDENDFYPNIYSLNTGPALTALRLDKQPQRFYQPAA